MEIWKTDGWGRRETPRVGEASKWASEGLSEQASDDDILVDNDDNDSDDDRLLFSPPVHSVESNPLRHTEKADVWKIHAFLSNAPPIQSLL